MRSAARAAGSVLEVDPVVGDDAPSDPPSQLLARLAVSRALIEQNPEHRPALKAEGLLTRDPRMKERKKKGQPGARKRFQFSKR